MIPRQPSQYNASPSSNARGRTQPPGNPAPTPSTPSLASRIAAVIAGHLGPFARSGPPGARPLDERALPLLLQQASDRQCTPRERLARFEAIFNQLPARNDASGPLHARCLQAILTLIDPVERRDLFLHYHRRHRFQLRTDPTPRLFALVSELQKPEHRPTQNAWASLDRVWSPGPSTNWPVWRGLCRVLAAQMAEVVQAFQQSRESPANKRDFNELVLRAVLRLAAPAGGDAQTVLARQFELLSDLAQALAADHRSSGLQALERACAQWIEEEMNNWPTKPMPEPELGLLAALRLLGEQHGDPAQERSAVRLDDCRAESAAQGFVDQLRKGQRPRGASKL